ncbi:MAG: thioredoxin family protein [Halobacteria archaeon]
MTSKLALPVALALIASTIVGLEQLRAGGGAGPAPPVASGIPASAAALKGPAAPELRGIAGYLNTEPNLTLSSLRGRAVLVDFWTYSCINCQRTLPYLKAWDAKYRDRGLTIVGVHTPEFAFEKSRENVARFVEENGIRYPVVQDNDYATWRAYQNNYWPRKYLVDKDGAIRYDHIGEGAYEETERKIQELLAERDAALKIDKTMTLPSDTPAVDFRKILTPELYLGYKFARAPLANVEGFAPGQVVNYRAPAPLPANRVGLEGAWRNSADYSELVSGAGRVLLNYSAKSVNIVAGGNGTVEVLLNGRPVPAESRGRDVAADGSATVAAETLYNLVSAPDYGARALELRVSGAGFRLYTFTFG